MSEQPPEQPPPPQQPPPQNPYGGAPYQAYGGAPTGPPNWAPDHPQATTVLLLGILGIAICQVCAPFAWVIGSRVRKEIDANPAQYGGRSQVQIGYVLGIVGSALLAFYVLAFVAYIVIIVGVVASGA